MSISNTRKNWNRTTYTGKKDKKWQMVVALALVGILCFPLHVFASNMRTVWVSDVWKLADYLDDPVDTAIVLTADFPVWQMNVVGNKIIYGQGHRLSNATGDGTCILVNQPGANVWVDQVIFDGCGARSNPRNWEPGTACVLNNQATFSATNCVFQSSYNQAYLNCFDTGGGTGFVNAGGTANLTNCIAANCDGAGFYNGDSRNPGQYANMTLTNCQTWDCSGGAMNPFGGTLHINGGCFTVNRYYGDAICNQGSGTLTINGTTTKATSQYMIEWGNGHGIQNAGNGRIIIENATATQCRQGIYNCNMGTIILKNANVYGNSFHGIENYGTIEVSGGSIHDNGSNGIENVGRVIQTGGNIYSNKGHGVRQSGTYEMSQNAKVDASNAVYLESNRIITLTGVLHAANAATINLAPGDRTPLRKVAETSYHRSWNGTEPEKNKLRLAFDKTTDNRTAILRSGTGENSQEGNIVVSQSYDITYNKNLHTDKIQVILPQKGVHYYNESTWIKNAIATPYVGDHSIAKSLVFGKWNTAEDASGVVYARNFIYGENRDLQLYAGWSTDYDLTYHGNGQTTGDDFTAQHIQAGYAMAQNPFEREDHSFQGWSMDETSQYYEMGIHKPGEKIDTLGYLIEGIDDPQTVVSPDGYVTLFTNVVWDKFPEITSIDRYLYQEEIEGLTMEDILSGATGTDQEDGTLAHMTQGGEQISYNSLNNVKSHVSPGVYVVDFDRGDLQGLGERADVTVTYAAVDGVGNISYGYGIFHLTTRKPANIATYTRRISRENYDKIYEEGGLERTSLWYTDTDYAKTLCRAFDRMEESNPMITYQFRAREVRQSQAYVKRHGIGKMKEEGGLKNWCEEFKKCVL